MSRTALSRHAARLAAAFALGCALALILSSGGASRARAQSANVAAVSTTPSTAPAPTATDRFAHTPAGAAAAATAWCQTTTEAFIDGGWDRAVSTLTTGAFRAHALRYAAAAALVQRRLAAAHTPHTLRLSPLGYATLQYSPTSARVQVWQLYVLAISGPEADTEFTTATVALQWTDGDWKVTSAPPGPDLAPPAVSASPAQVATWIRSANRLERYAYVP